MGKFDKQTATAKRLIEKNGTLLTFKNQATAFDPTTGSYAGSEAEYTGTAVVLPVDNETRNRFPELVNSTLRKLLSSELSQSPELNDSVVIDGKDNKIIELKALNPANDGVILYTMVIAI